MEFLVNIFIYGSLGILTEVIFTGIKSLLEKDWRATSQTYLWMWLVYGLGAMVLKAIKNNVALSDNWLLNPLLMSFFIYTPLIFGFEFLFGLLLKKLIGRVPWEYKPGRFTVMGAIRLDYAPYWMLLGMVFVPVSNFVTKTLELVLK